MKVSKELLLPFVDETNSKPCPFCGKYHKIVLSSNPAAYIELVGEACEEWVRLVHNNAMKILENSMNGNLGK